MATVSYVVNAIDDASRTFARVAGSADALHAQLEELKERVDVPLSLEDKQFNVGIADASVKLDKLSKKISTPGISDAQMRAAQREILKTDLMLDELDRKKVEPEVKVKVDTSALSRLRGVLGSRSGGGILGKLPGGGGVGGAGGAGGPGGGGILSGAPLIGGLGAGGGTAAIAAAIAALPFIAQAAGGGIVTALGGAMVAVGVIGSRNSALVGRAFTDLKTTASGALNAISQPFHKVLADILNAATSVIPKLFGAMGDAIAAIAGPFDRFGTTLLKAFGSPAVAQSLKAVGEAFGGILKALTPMLPGMIDSIATGITRIANTIKDNPKAFADFIWFLTHTVAVAFDTIAALTSTANYIEKHFVPAFLRAGHDIEAAWNATWNNTIGRLQRFVADDQKLMDQLRHSISNTFDSIRHDIAATWNTIWNNTVARVQSGVHAVLAWFDNQRSSIGNRLANLRSAIAAAWSTIWNNTVSRVQSGINTVVGWFRGLPGRAVSALSGLGHSLAAFARAAINEMWTGFKNTFSAVIHWFTGLPKMILHALGIHSPPNWAISAGRDIMKGLHIGLGHGLGQLTSFTTSIGDRVAAALSGAFGGSMGDSGARTHSAAVAQAYARSLLSQYGWSAAQMNALIPLWNQESGWSAYAVNKASGAYGIPQSLGHGHPYNLGDYKNQIIWGLNYIRQRYGSPAAAWQHEMAYNWYDAGGYLPTGASLALNTTGRPEPVTTAASMDQVAALLRETNMLLRAIPATTGRALGETLNGTARAAAYRGIR